MFNWGNDKLLDVWATIVDIDTRVAVLEGPARSSKTAVAIQAFKQVVDNSEDQYHAICGRDYDAINNNILNAPIVGLLLNYKELSLKKDVIGGYRVEYIDKQCRKKVILLAGYNNATQWKKILGGTISTFFIDEANIADPSFVNETFARQISCEHPHTIMTMNGDDPEAFIYQNYVNYCNIVGEVPSSTRVYMEEFQKEKGVKPEWYYFHFRLEDNPIMTPEKLEAARAIYPVGSYYYITKILGERGKQGALIYNDYMTRELITDYTGLDLHHYTIGFDIGQKRAYNSIVLTGWTGNYDKCIAIKLLTFKQCGYNEKTEALKQFVREAIILAGGAGLIEGVYVDSAEMNYITDLAPIIEREFNIRVRPSMKYTIKERIDMNIIGFSRKTVLFNKTCEEIYTAYQSMVWEKNKIGEVREDLNEKKNDICDSFEYSQTPHMQMLLKGR